MSYAYLYFLNTDVVCLFMLFTHESYVHGFHVQMMHDIHV
jgi:hypothetical protein